MPSFWFTTSKSLPHLSVWIPSGCRSCALWTWYFIFILLDRSVLTPFCDQKASVVLVGNKLDVRGDGLTQERLDKLIIPMMNKYREIETCVECSAKTMMNVVDVFKYAEKNVLHPTKHIYDTDAHVCFCLSLLFRGDVMLIDCCV